MNNYETGYFSLKNKAITELKANVFKTYCYLISKNFKMQGIWHSQQTIANDLKVSVRTVQRHLRLLADQGYIQKKRRGFNMTNIYTLLKSVVEKVKEKKEEMTNNFKKSFSNKEKPKLKFNNFQAREYDYDKLERQLLGWE